MQEDRSGFVRKRMQMFEHKDTDPGKNRDTGNPFLDREQKRRVEQHGDRGETRNEVVKWNPNQSSYTDQYGQNENQEHQKYSIAIEDREYNRKEKQGSRGGMGNEVMKWIPNQAAYKDQYGRNVEQEHSIAIEGLQPITLAKVEDESLKVDNDALYYLMEKDELKGKPLAIVSIAGTTRSGKSFIMNFFLKYLRNKGWANPDWFGDDSSRLRGGFPWRKGTEACTQGINVWPEIFHVPLSDGRECAVVIVDTQGLYDDDTSPDTNAKLMSLSTLFCSHQILNLMRQIEERDLEHLQLCVSFGKAAADMKICGNKKAFQSLTFLVRDWKHDDQLGNTTDTYLLPYLRKTSKSSIIKKVKKSISDSFDKIQSYCLPHPGANVIRNKKELQNKDVDEIFVMLAKMLVESVLHPNNIAIKKMGGGKDATADDLKNMIETVGNNFVGEKMRTAGTLLQNVVRANNTKSMSTAVAGYRKEMSKQIGNKIVKNDDLKKHHAMSVTKALKTFNELAKIGDESDKEDFRKQLDKECGDAFKSYGEINETRKSKLLNELQTLKVKCLENYKQAMKMFDLTVTDEVFEQINAKNIREVQDAFDTEAKNLEEVLPQIIDMKNELEIHLGLISSDLTKTRKEEKEKQRTRNGEKCTRLAYELEEEFDNEVDQEYKEFKADLSSELKASMKKYISQYKEKTNDIPELDVVEENKQKLQRRLNKIVHAAEKQNKKNRAAVALQFPQTQRECLAEYRKKLRKIGLKASDDEFDKSHKQFRANALKTFDDSTKEHSNIDFPEIPTCRSLLDEDICDIFEDTQEKRTQERAAKKSKMKDEAHREMRRIFSEFEDTVEQYNGEYRTSFKKILDEAKSDCLEKFKERFSSGFESDIVTQNEQILKSDIGKAIQRAEAINENRKNSMITQLATWKTDCLAQYKSKIKNVEIEQLSSKHQQEQTQALQMFDSRSKDNGNLEEVKRQRKMLDDDIAEAFVEVKSNKLRNEEIKENELRAKSETCKKEKIDKFEQEVRKYRKSYKEEQKLKKILQDEKATAMKSYETEMMTNSQKDPESLETELEKIKENTLSHNEDLKELLTDRCRNKGRDFAEQYEKLLEKEMRETYLKSKVFDNTKDDFLEKKVYTDEEYEKYPDWGKKIVKSAIQQKVIQLKEQNKSNKKHRSIFIKAKDTFVKVVKAPFIAVARVFKRKSK